MPDLPILTEDKRMAWALFLDVDGTLLEIAEHPDAVVVPDGLVALLHRLGDMFGGAVALISGRSLMALDALLGETGLDAAGCHGSEIRIGGTKQVLAAGDREIPLIAERLARLVEGIPSTMVEIKPHSIALHFKPPATNARLALALAEKSLAGENGRFRILSGKNVVEILPSGAGKGRAIAHFLKNPRYAGRTPVFIGDDVTDEEGFREANDRGGLSIRVGAPDGETAASHRAKNVAEIAAWLKNLTNERVDG